MEEYWRWFMYQTKILPEQRVKCLEYFETPENMFIAPAAKVEKAEFLSEAATLRPFWARKAPSV